MTSPHTDNTFSQLVSTDTDTTKDNYLFLVNKVTSILYVKKSTSTHWVITAEGELGDLTVDILKRALRQGRVFWIETKMADLKSFDISKESPVTINLTQLKEWVAQANKITLGRGSDPDAKVKQIVGCAAGWHCQFDGCGEDLTLHTLPGVRGNFSYFAHIIASSADGPRGDPIESPKRAQDPENLMLLCDKCHRLIDRVDPRGHSAEMLFEMRKRNIKEVSHLFETLKFDVVEPIIVVQDIEGQPANYNDSAGERAMWGSKLRKGGRDSYFFMRNGSLSSSNDHGYWYGMFKAMQQDIPSLVRRLKGNDTATGKPKHIALFPLHSTSVLIATGRIVGEASTITQFQFHRDQVGLNSGGQWSWPKAIEPTKDKYKLTIDRDMDGNHSEALILVYLTALIPNQDLPTSFFAEGKLKFPTIKISIDEPSRAVIGHPNDLELFGRVVDAAYSKIQDEWHIKTVHLIVIAPATACVRVGQKMQARNQADFILYERNQANATKAFQPTITITSTQIKHDSGEGIDIKSL